MDTQALYVLEKLSTAVSTLAVHPGAIKDRLRAAGVEIIIIPRTNLPTWEQIAEDVEWIYNQLTKR